MGRQMSASKLIHYFSSHPVTFGFWTSLPPDNIRGLTSLSDFEAGTGAAVHSTLDTGQLTIKDSIPPSKDCLYECINWSLVQAQPQSFLGLCQSSTSMRGARARPRAESQFNVQKQPVTGPGDAPLTKKPHLYPKPDGHQGSRKSPRGASTSTTDCKKKGCHEGYHSWSVSLHHLQLLCRSVPTLNS